MGCLCCKRKNNEKKTFSEEQTQTDEDIEEKLINSTSRETDINNIKTTQELPTKENVEEKNIENEKSAPKPEELMPYELCLKDYLDENIDNSDVFDKKWYSDIEKDKIIFSKRSIIALLNQAFDDKNQEYKEIYNKPPLVLSIKSTGSFITDQFQVSRNIFTTTKTSFPKNTSLKMISKYMLNSKERNSWDSQFKLYAVIEGSEEGKEVKCILHNWMKSPMFLISERDIVDKRYDFFHNGRFYSFESSVNDDYIPLEENVTRINDIIFIQEVYEENENFVFRAMTQMNAKISLPQAIINNTLSGKLLDFYNGVINAMNSDFDEGKLIFEDNDGNIIENEKNDDIKIKIDDIE